MNTQEVVGGIFTGEFDDELNDIVAAINSRRDTISRNKVKSISVGDVVIFNSSIRPKYLEGKEAKVTKVNRKTVTVSIPDDPNYRKYAGSASVRCPVSLLEVV